MKRSHRLPELSAADQESQRLFGAYCEASRKAQASLAFDDAKIAGQAWAAFIQSFVRPHAPGQEQRP